MNIYLHNTKHTHDFCGVAVDVCSFTTCIQHDFCDVAVDVCASWNACVKYIIRCFKWKLLLFYSLYQLQNESQHLYITLGLDTILYTSFILSSITHTRKGRQTENIKYHTINWFLISGKLYSSPVAWLVRPLSETSPW